jgi:formate dehydrogenase accessory protein FdhD
MMNQPSSRIARFGATTISVSAVVRSWKDTAVALTCDDGTHAVMMTTPQDLEDLAVGFSLIEEIIISTVKLDSLEILRLCDGIEPRMWLSGPKGDRLKGAMAAYCGPTGCGLCGIESVAEASRPVAVIGAAGITIAAIADSKCSRVLAGFCLERLPTLWAGRNLADAGQAL